MTTSRGLQAVLWMLSAPPGTRRSQAEAGRKFGITQTAVSQQLDIYFRDNPEDRPDARRKRALRR